MLAAGGIHTYDSRIWASKNSHTNGNRAQHKPGARVHHHFAESSVQGPLLEVGFVIAFDHLFDTALLYCWHCNSLIEIDVLLSSGKIIS